MGHLEKTGHLLDGAHARRGHLFDLPRGAVFDVALDADRLLHIGGVVAAGAVDNLVLAAPGDEHELVGVLAADGAAVRLDEQGRQAAALINFPVGLNHLPVAHVQPGLVGVKAVEVFHGELAHPDESAAGTRLVTELGLNLVKHQGEVAVAPDVAAHQLGDDFLVGGAQGQRALAAVVEGKEHLAQGFAAPGKLPQLEGLEHRQAQLLAARPVHLFPHDVLNLLEHPPGQRQIRIDPGHELVDHARPDEQLVADRVRLGGDFP